MLLWLFTVVDVAQLVRAPDCDSGGRGFKSRLPPQFSGYAVVVVMRPGPAVKFCVRAVSSVGRAVDS